jgi:hypothetical protein
MSRISQDEDVYIDIDRIVYPQRNPFMVHISYFQEGPSPFYDMFYFNENVVLLPDGTIIPPRWGEKMIEYDNGVAKFIDKNDNIITRYMDFYNNKEKIIGGTSSIAEPFTGNISEEFYFI